MNNLPDLFDFTEEAWEDTEPDLILLRTGRPLRTLLPLDDRDRDLDRERDFDLERLFLDPPDPMQWVKIKR